MEQKGVLFDMDGVLVDSGPIHREAWKRLAREAGRPMEDSFFDRVFGMRNEEILEELLGPGLDRERKAALGKRKEEIYRALARERLAPAPGAAELVAALEKAGFRLALASSGPRANVELMLDVTGLGREMETYVSAEDVERGKPDPQVFLEAARRLALPPGRCVVVEDAAVGVRAARRAGMKVVGVAAGGDREVLREADLVVSSLEELSPRVFEELLEVPWET
ncbi:MAG TPA: HAD family phosphatase [Planctomycetes bacterium]|nr:HAD family phosphatase [Planctomycetota bacterium]